MASAYDTEPVTFIFTSDHTKVRVVACTTAVYKQWLVEGIIRFGRSEPDAPQPVEVEDSPLAHDPGGDEEPARGQSIDRDEEPAELVMK